MFDMLIVVLNAGRVYSTGGGTAVRSIGWGADRIHGDLDCAVRRDAILEHCRWEGLAV